MEIEIGGDPLHARVTGKRIQRLLQCQGGRLFISIERPQCEYELSRK